MEKENLTHDEFHGEITNKDLKRAEELDASYTEDDFVDDEGSEDDYPTDYPKTPPMDELFDESDKETDYDDEYEK